MELKNTKTMGKLFQDKYRIPSTRLINFDYGNNGMYYLTICTSNRVCFFGQVETGKMILNEMGQLAEKYWLEIPQQFNYIELGDFVVMPNHIHGILIIQKTSTVETQFIASKKESDINNSVEMQFIASCNINEEKDAINCVSTKGGFAGSKNPLLNNNISRVIRCFKGRCSFEIRKFHADFGWQARFYDHIIRNEKSLKNIESYIQDNPENFDGTTE